MTRSATLRVPKIRNVYQKIRTGDVVTWSVSWNRTASGIVLAKESLGALRIHASDRESPAILYAQDVISIIRRDKEIV